MAITIQIPTALRRFTDGADSVSCTAANLSDLLSQLETRFPKMSTHLRDEEGNLRSFVNIYVNEEDIRFLGGEKYQFQDGDQVLLVPSIAGGLQ